jgi:hypothetical protein
MGIVEGTIPGRMHIRWKVGAIQCGDRITSESGRNVVFVHVVPINFLDLSDWWSGGGRRRSTVVMRLVRVGIG